VFPVAIIGDGVKVKKAIIGENAIVGANAVIGGPLRDGETVDNSLTGDITLVANDYTVEAGAYLPCGAVATEQ